MPVLITDYCDSMNYDMKYTLFVPHTEHSRVKYNLTLMNYISNPYYYTTTEGTLNFVYSNYESYP